MSKPSLSTARIQLTVLSILATAASGIAGAILLAIGLSLDRTDGAPGMEELATLAGFSVLGTGVLLVSFALFVVGVSFSLLQIFRALEA